MSKKYKTNWQVKSQKVSYEKTFSAQKKAVKVRK